MGNPSPVAFLDQDRFRRELYRLLAYTFASKAFASHHNKDPEDPILILQRDFVHKELHHSLLHAAAFCRMLDNHESRVTQYLIQHCGRLIPDKRAPKVSEKLTLREACNKLIHAESISWRVVGQYRHIPDSGYINGRLTLTGRDPLKRKDWAAELDLVQFARLISVLWHQTK